MWARAVSCWGSAFVIVLGLLGVVVYWGQDALSLDDKLFEMGLFFEFWVVFTLASVVILFPLSRFFYKGKFWRMWIQLNFSLFMLILIFFTGWIGLTAWPTRVAEANGYMTVAEPALISYCETHGHYPKSLGELNLGTSPPWGLDYAVGDMEHPLEWRANNWTGYDSEYQIEFGDRYYRGRGEWDVGDL